MKRLKKKQLKRPRHLHSHVVVMMNLHQYTGRQLAPRKVEAYCILRGNNRGRFRVYDDPKNRRIIVVWFDGRYYSAFYGPNRYMEQCSMNMAEYKRLNSHF